MRSTKEIRNIGSWPLRHIRARDPTSREVDDDCKERTQARCFDLEPVDLRPWSDGL
jgi:hypothetical protein